MLKTDKKIVELYNKDSMPFLFLPNPVVLITSSNRIINNVCTVSWISVLCSSPFYIGMGLRRSRLSYELITHNRHFGINIPTSKMVKEVDYCGHVSGRNVNKFERLNLEYENSITNDIPIIKSCPINFECELRQIVKLGSHDLIVGAVLNTFADLNIVRDSNTINIDNMNLLFFVHNEYWSADHKINDIGFSLKMSGAMIGSDY